jgi:hypothetical protein
MELQNSATRRRTEKTLEPVPMLVDCAKGFRGNFMLCYVRGTDLAHIYGQTGLRFASNKDEKLVAPYLMIFTCTIWSGSQGPHVSRNL